MHQGKSFKTKFLKKRSWFESESLVLKSKFLMKKFCFESEMPKKNLNESLALSSKGFFGLCCLEYQLMTMLNWTRLQATKASIQIFGQITGIKILLGHQNVLANVLLQYLTV